MSTVAVTLPPPTPCASKSLSSDQLAEHRSRIGIEVEVVLQGYWQAEVAPTMKAAILADWADEMEDWHVDQVRWALRQWRRDNPSKRPNPGHIVAILKDRRGREAAQKIAVGRSSLPAPGQHRATREERRVSAERAKELLAAAGFAPLRMDDAQ